jgi:hypothetical protein
VSCDHATDANRKSSNGDGILLQTTDLSYEIITGDKGKSSKEKGIGSEGKCCADLNETIIENDELQTGSKHEIISNKHVEHSQMTSMTPTHAP